MSSGWLKKCSVYSPINYYAKHLPQRLFCSIVLTQTHTHTQQTNCMTRTTNNGIRMFGKTRLRSDVKNSFILVNFRSSEHLSDSVWLPISVILWFRSRWVDINYQFWLNQNQYWARIGNMYLLRCNCWRVMSGQSLQNHYDPRQQEQQHRWVLTKPLEAKIIAQFLITKHMCW